MFAKLLKQKTHKNEIKRYKINYVMDITIIEVNWRCN